MRTRRERIQREMMDRVDAAYREIADTGDFGGLQELIDEVSGEERAIGIIRAFEKKSIEQMMGTNDLVASSFRRSGRNPYLWRRLLDELLARALIEDETCFRKAPQDRVRELVTAFVRLQKAYQGRDIRCEKDCEAAMEAFRRLYEIYLKATHVLAALLDVIERKPMSQRRRRKSLYARLAAFEGGRYSSLVPDETKTIMRDAIGHESVRIDATNSCVVFESEGGSRRLSYRTVDLHVSEMLARIAAFLDALTLSEGYFMKIAEASLLSRARERKRTIREFRRVRSAAAIGHG